MFGNSEDSSKGSIFDLDTDLSSSNLKLFDETINSHSNILDASVSKTAICGSNLSTPQINEEKVKARWTTGRCNKTASWELQ